MNRKFDQLTIMDAFIMEKVLGNVKIGRRFMKHLIGKRIHHIVCPKNNIVKQKDGTTGVFVEIYISGKEKRVINVTLYLCREDKFGRGCPVYCFEEICKEAPDLKPIESAQQIYIVPTDNLEDKQLDEEIKAFLYYIKNPKDKRTNLIKMIDDEVRRIKMNKLFKKEYEEQQREETEKQQRIYAEICKRGKKTPSIVI